MYVGGERMTLDADLDYADQPDWVDNAGDPLWVDPGEPGRRRGGAGSTCASRRSGAVEDPALLDVALGGPDTSERLRIVQRVVRSATGEDTCAGALADLEQGWAEQGLTFDPDDDAARVRGDAAGLVPGGRDRRRRSASPSPRAATSAPRTS